MMVNVHWNLIVYIIIAVVGILGIVWDISRYVNNGYFSDKQEGEMGMVSLGIISVFISFSLIWGGIFWW